MCEIVSGQAMSRAICGDQHAKHQGTVSRKRKSEKLSRKDGREDYVRRSQATLKRAAAEKETPRDDNVLHMATVIRGVKMLAATRKNEFDMLARALDLYGPDDPRAGDKLKDKMFELITNRQSMCDRISEVKKHRQESTIDLTVASPSVDIDPIHAAAAMAYQ